MRTKKAVLNTVADPGGGSGGSGTSLLDPCFFFFGGGRGYPPVVCFPLLAKQYCSTGVHRNMCSQSAFFQPVPSAVVKHDRSMAEKYHAEQALFYFNFSFRRAEARTRSTNDARRECPSRRA